MRFLALVLTIAGLVSGATLSVGKPAPPLKIVEPGGKTTQLSDYKGKVVVVQFLFTYCQHCQRYSRMLTSMQKDLGPKGFQPLGIAIDDDVTTQKVAQYIKEQGVTFPVLVGDRIKIKEYLGVSPNERFGVPQILIVDRKGNVRYQTTPMPEATYFTEAPLRGFLDKLLKEPAGVASKAAKAK